MQLGRAALYGESIFTSFRTIEGSVPGWDDHLRRLFSSVADYYFCSRKTINELQSYYLPEDMADKFLEFPNHYFRLTFWSESQGLMSGLSEVHLKIDCNTLPMSGQTPGRLLMMESPFSSHQLGIKSGSYFQSFAMKKHSQRRGFDDVLFTHGDEITEASTSSIIFRMGERFITPEFKGGLESISLKKFAEFCHAHQLHFTRRIVQTRELENFHEAYLLNSVQLIKAIGSVNKIHYNTNENLQLFYKKYLGVK